MRFKAICAVACTRVPQALLHVQEEEIANAQDELAVQNCSLFLASSKALNSLRCSVSCVLQVVCVQQISYISTCIYLVTLIYLLYINVYKILYAYLIVYILYVYTFSQY